MRQTDTIEEQDPTSTLLSDTLGDGRLVLVGWAPVLARGEGVPDTRLGEGYLIPIFGEVPDAIFLLFYRFLSYCHSRTSSEEVILQGLSRIRSSDSEFTGGT